MKRLALILCLLLVGVGCKETPKINEEPKVVREKPLKIERQRVELRQGATAEIRILSGNANYHLKSSDSQVATATIEQENVIVIRGVGAGSCSITLEDLVVEERIRIAVQVLPQVYETTLSDLVSTFITGVQSQQYSTSRLSTTKLRYSQESLYQLSVDGVRMQLLAESVGGKDIAYRLTLGEPAEGRAVFFKLLSQLGEQEGAQFLTAFIGKYDEQGVISSKGLSKYATLDALKQAEAQANWAKDLVRAAYNLREHIVECRMDGGRFTLIMRPKRLHDHWKWYFTLLDKNFNGTQMDWHYQVTRTGMMPPNFQLFIMEGEGTLEQTFNVVVFAQAKTPVERVEISFRDIAGKADAVLRTWLTIVGREDVEQALGKFEKAIVFLGEGKEPKVLTSLEEAIAFARSTDFSSFTSFMPIFRNEGRQVIIPQITNSALVITIGYLDRES